MARGHINTVTGDTSGADWEYTQLHRTTQGKNISMICSFISLVLAQNVTLTNCLSISLYSVSL